MPVKLQRFAQKGALVPTSRGEAGSAACVPAPLMRVPRERERPLAVGLRASSRAESVGRHHVNRLRKSRQAWEVRGEGMLGGVKL
eukprot:2229020-Pleurochrysis_carterae.AAC.1